MPRCPLSTAGVHGVRHGLSIGRRLRPLAQPVPSGRKRSAHGRVRPRLLVKDVALPDRFRLAATAGRLGKLVRAALPGELRGMLELLPADLPPAQPLPEIFPAVGKRRGRVALLAGCVQQVLAPKSIGLRCVSWHRMVLRRSFHVDKPVAARCRYTSVKASRRGELARINLGIFPSDIDAIITNAAGCGSGMHEYGLLFAGQMDAERAAAFGNKVRILPFSWTKQASLRREVCPSRFAAYHDACHLAHRRR